MFKRSTKLTALLVAAASVASTVPAMAATKLATKDGTVENAVAYKDGKYLYQGYRTDSDDNGLYIGDGSEKDKMLDDADEIDQKFGDKYVSVTEGSDDYYVVDLESGKITDEDTLEDLESTATTKLINKLNKTERYDGLSTLVSITNEEDNSFTGTEKEIKRVASNKLEEVYYAYNVPSAESTDDDGDNVKYNKFGYTNDSGKYIDCSYDLNLYAYSTTDAASNGKMYKIEDIDDKAEASNGEKIKVTSVEFVKYIGQDDKYIYSVIKVGLKNSYSLYTGNKIDSATQHYYVQKVSKEQGDKQDDAYLPKTTECFEIAPKDTTDLAMGNGDVNDAYNALVNQADIAGKENTKYVVVDGTIYTYFEDDTDKIKIFKIQLRTSEKLDRYNATEKDRNASKISGHVARKDGDKDHDMTEVQKNGDDYKNQPWTIDANGTLWIIDEGKIYKSVKMGDFEEVYTCDRSLDCIDVYDENNLIAWDSDGDVYTTVGEGSEAAQEEAKEIVKENVTTEPAEPAVTVKTGWDQLADGTWNLYDATGKKVTGWANVGGVWYYMDPITAVMKTGWLNDNGTWYYLQSSGAMKTGWFQDTDGRWYYLNANGSMAANTTVDGYVLGANGAWIK